MTYPLATFGDFVKVKDGDKITVSIGGKPIETTIINGVQRLPQNPVYQALFDCRALDLNQLAIAYQTGKIPFEHYLEVYLNIGYSVSGFCELSSFKHLSVVNPLWEQ